MNILKKYAKIGGLFLCIVCLMGVLSFPFKKKRGFTVEKISSNIPHRSEWSIENSHVTCSLDEIFSQDFSYLGNGAQCYAFVSQDQKFVIKFFKMKHLLPKNWLNYVPLPGLKQYRYDKIDRRNSRLQKTFNGYKQVFDELKEESGLIYIHLNKSRDIQKKLHLIDRKGQRHEVELDAVLFVVQEKAELIYPHISRLMQEGNGKAAELAIKAFVQLINSRVSRGFFDCDKVIGKNYGFTKERAIQIDLGQICRETPPDKEKQRHEISQLSKKLENWLLAHYPQLLPALHMSLGEFSL